MDKTNAEPLINVRDLVVSFSDQVVLNHLSIDVRRGEVLGLVGASGGGKSVLLRTIIGLLAKQEGKITLFGADLDTTPLESMRAIERRWGILFQQGALFSSLSARQNVEFPMREYLSLSDGLREEVALAKLGMVGLSAEDAEKFPSELSGGMTKRAALARALSLDPEIVFLDEIAASQGQAPVLVADPGASQDLTQAARQTLQSVDKILVDNSEAVKGTIDNLNKFTGALARNSDSVDAVMTGLARLARGAPAEKPKPTYDLAAPSAVATPAPASKRQLVIPRPTAIIALQTQRMLARSTDGQISQLGDAQWSDSLPDLIQAKIVQSLDRTGFLITAGGADQQPASTDRLLIDLRDFAVTVSPDPVANIAFAAKIVDQNGQIVATKLFQASATASGTNAPQIAAAFNGAFGNVATDLANWISREI